MIIDCAEPGNTHTRSAWEAYKGNPVLLGKTGLSEGLETEPFRLGRDVFLFAYWSILQG